MVLLSLLAQQIFTRLRTGTNGVQLLHVPRVTAAETLLHDLAGAHTGLCVIAGCARQAGARGGAGLLHWPCPVDRVEELARVRGEAFERHTEPRALFEELQRRLAAAAR